MPDAMPKKVNATIDEVNEAAAKLEEQIKSARAQVESAFQKQLAALEEKLRGEVNKVQSNVDRVDSVKVEQESSDKVAVEAERRLAQVAAEIRKEIEAVTPPIADEIERVCGAFEQKIEQTDASSRRAFLDELGSLAQNFDGELAAAKKALQEQIISQGADIAGALRRERVEIDGHLRVAMEDAAAAAQEAQRIAAEELQKVLEAQEKTDKKQDAKAKSVQQDNELKFIEVEATIQKRADEAAAALAKAIAKAEKELAEEHAEVDENFKKKNDDIAALWASFADVENVPTRKVEWTVREAASRLLPPNEGEEQPYGTWFSPTFDAAGARGLRLELRTYGPTSPESEDQHKGNCALFLHASAGSHVAFKLSIAKCSESFEHQFDGEEPCGSKRLCFFEQNLSTQNTLTVGVEVLECIAELDKKCEKPEVYLDENGDEKPWLESSFKLSRHVNNRVLDMVKTQMDYMKKRMTRRIEWRLEQASLMLANFPRGAPMRSKEFDAAGIDGMQLHFYPAGYDTSMQGMCSLFLSAPQGCTLRCSLQIGAEKKDVNHTFDTTGLCGKLNYMRFEWCFDKEDDCVIISLDIHEAHVDLVAKVSHPPPVAVGVRSFPKEAQPLIPLGSTMKLTRYADSLPDVLREVKILPSLWAGKNRFELDVKVSGGLKPLKDTKKGRPKSGGFAGRRSPSSPLLR